MIAVPLAGPNSHSARFARYVLSKSLRFYSGLCNKSMLICLPRLVHARKQSRDCDSGRTFDTRTRENHAILADLVPSGLILMQKKHIDDVWIGQATTGRKVYVHAPRQGC